MTPSVPTRRSSGLAVARQPDGRLRVEFRLWDVYGEQQMAGFAYHTQPQNWRRVAHIIADEIYKRITGEQGYFRSEEHTSELQSLMSISFAVFCLTKQKNEQKQLIIQQAITP